MNAIRLEATGLELAVRSADGVWHCTRALHAETVRCALCEPDGEPPDPLRWGEARRLAQPLVEALEVVLLFHSLGPWDDKAAERWTLLTGERSASTRALCDHVRAVLHEWAAVSHG